MIPATLHVNWHTPPLDEFSQKMFEFWTRGLGPDWRVHLWTHAHEEALPYPELFRYAENYGEWSDICRYQCLALGGLYADLDTLVWDAEALKNDLRTIDNLVAGEVYRPGSTLIDPWESGNWLLAGCRNSEFWHYVCRRLGPWIDTNEQDWRGECQARACIPTLWKTGPRFLSRMVREWAGGAWGAESLLEGPATRAGVTLWPPSYGCWVHRPLWPDGLLTVPEGVRVVHGHGGSWPWPQHQWEARYKEGHLTETKE